MGLIKAIVGATGGVLADQWKEFFVCDSLSSDVLVAKGEKKQSKRSSNKRGEENIITNGSTISVSDGQSMIIVEQGKIVEFCAEPGEFTYDNTIEPSIFCGNLSENIKKTFENIGHRFTYGGTAPTDQRIYFVNTKEIIGNKYGTPSPVPFRVVDNNIGLDIDIAIRCHGEYSYKIVDPILFYTNVCGNISGEYSREEIDSQLKSELMTALQPAFAKISEMGIRYSALPGHTIELADALNEVLSKKWGELRGIRVNSFGVSSVNASEEDEAMIKEIQRNAAFRNPNMAAAHLVGAQAEAMKNAAANQGGGGAFMGFAGMNMAANSANNIGNLYQMGNEQQSTPQGQPAIKPQPQNTSSWICSCGATNTGKFCSECGAPKSDEWICSCGATNKGKFCSECGGKKPE